LLTVIIEASVGARKLCVLVLGLGVEVARYAAEGELLVDLGALLFLGGSLGGLLSHLLLLGCG